MKKLTTLCGIVLAVSIFIPACTGGDDKNAAQQQPSASQPSTTNSSPTPAPAEPISVKAGTLIDECLKDESSFKKKYSDLAARNVDLRVTGKVTAVFDNGKALLGKDAQGSFVSCGASDSSKEAVSKLKPGQEVTLTCSYRSESIVSNSVAFIILDNCRPQ
jgi:uncharacterized lipoprotein YehR (DUF1307 family)